MLQRRSSVSDISERGVEWSGVGAGRFKVLYYLSHTQSYREMVNPERSWRGVMIKYSEGRGEIIDAPLCSHTLITTMLLLFIKNKCDFCDIPQA